MTFASAVTQPGLEVFIEPLRAMIGSWNVLSGGRLRLFDWQPNYAEPWETETLDKIKFDYYGDPFPLTQYFKHLFRRYEGEVALAWGRAAASP